MESDRLPAVIRNPRNEPEGTEIVPIETHPSKSSTMPDSSDSLDSLAYQRQPSM